MKCLSTVFRQMPSIPFYLPSAFISSHSALLHYLNYEKTASILQTWRHWAYSIKFVQSSNVIFNTRTVTARFSSALGLTSRSRKVGFVTWNVTAFSTRRLTRFYSCRKTAPAGNANKMSHEALTSEFHFAMKVLVHEKNSAPYSTSRAFVWESLEMFWQEIKFLLL
jgi:hypothetical protein